MPQIIKTDASEYAIAAIHSVRMPDRELHPITFHFWTLGLAKQNYDTHNKELLQSSKCSKSGITI
jgi:hypothetical protein